jgi:hypothetical protein
MEYYYTVNIIMSVILAIFAGIQLNKDNKGISLIASLFAIISIIIAFLNYIIYNIVPLLEAMK